VDIPAVVVAQQVAHFVISGLSILGVMRACLEQLKLSPLAQQVAEVRNLLASERAELPRLLNGTATNELESADSDA
jgi:hypothetical protein